LREIGCDDGDDFIKGSNVVDFIFIKAKVSARLNLYRYCRQRIALNTLLCTNSWCDNILFKYQGSIYFIAQPYNV
jgi:hypothetical protein